MWCARSRSHSKRRRYAREYSHSKRRRGATRTRADHVRLQPPSPTVAASLTYGCSLRHLRLQVRTEPQLAQAEASCRALGLDGLVLVGGPVSASDTAALAERFAARGVPTAIVAVPATIDGDH